MLLIFSINLVKSLISMLPIAILILGRREYIYIYNRGLYILIYFFLQCD
jgi:hypothetical protein